MLSPVLRAGDGSVLKIPGTWTLFLGKTLRLPLVSPVVSATNHWESSISDARPPFVMQNNCELYPQLTTGREHPRAPNTRTASCICN